MGLDFYNESSVLVKYIQDNDFNDNKLTNLYRITFNTKSILDDEVSIEKYIDDELDKITLIQFIQTLAKCLKVSLGNNAYKFTKND